MAEAATQIGQLIPGSAEKRMAAPRTEVTIARIHFRPVADLIAGTGVLIDVEEKCRVLYIIK
jgi:hypothetical protein